MHNHRPQIIALSFAADNRKNWLFSWTELGAKHVGIVQSLLVTCRLHDIDLYDYFLMYCNGLVSIRRHRYISSRHGCGSRCLPRILCVPIYTAWSSEAITLAGYRLRSSDRPHLEIVI